MAHFARLDENNIVTEVLVVDNATLGMPEDEAKGAAWLAWFDCLRELPAARWVQTSYNSKFRGYFAGVGMTYDETLDAFVAPDVPETK